MGGPKLGRGRWSRASSRQTIPFRTLTLSLPYLKHSTPGVQNHLKTPDWQSEVVRPGIGEVPVFGFGISLGAWKPTLAQEPCLEYCYAGGVGCTLSVSREVKKILVQRYWP